MRWVIAIVASSVALAASAIEPPKNAPAPAKPPAQEEPATPPPSDAPEGSPAAPAADDDEKLPPLPADVVPSGPPPQRFTPSEKVRADFPVSFPIDI